MEGEAILSIEDLVNIAAKSIEHEISSLNENEETYAQDIAEVVQEKDSEFVEKVLAKSLVGDRYEKPDISSKYQQQKKKKAERAKTAGAKWFDLPATEVTDEIRNDMKVLQIRNHIFKDRFYKKADPLPKYFQIGTVIENKADYYSSRLVKKQRSDTFVNELLKDSQFKNYAKKKFHDIQKIRASGGKQAYQKKQLGKTPIWKQKR